jgi:hypothetical protein
MLSIICAADAVADGGKGVRFPSAGGETTTGLSCAMAARPTAT